jgi:hypothetical protein
MAAQERRLSRAKYRAKISDHSIFWAPQITKFVILLSPWMLIATLFPMTSTR